MAVSRYTQMFWAARRKEGLLLGALYRFHPRFSGAMTWWGDPDRHYGAETLEGGDVMPIGQGVVLVGMGERASPQAVTQVARHLFAGHGARCVIAGQLTKKRTSMHLDTVFSFLDIDLVSIYPEVAERIRCTSLYPGDAPGEIRYERHDQPFLKVVAGALGVHSLRVLTRVAMPMKRNGSNGTTAITCWRSTGASSSLMTAIPAPTARCATRAST